MPRKLGNGCGDCLNTLGLVLEILGHFENIYGNSLPILGSALKFSQVARLEIVWSKFMGFVSFVIAFCLVSPKYTPRCKWKNDTSSEKCVPARYFIIAYTICKVWPTASNPCTLTLYKMLSLTRAQLSREAATVAGNILVGLLWLRHPASFILSWLPARLLMIPRTVWTRCLLMFHICSTGGNNKYAEYRKVHAAACVVEDRATWKAWKPGRTKSKHVHSSCKKFTRSRERFCFANVCKVLGPDCFLGIWCPIAGPFSGFDTALVW